MLLKKPGEHLTVYIFTSKCVVTQKNPVGCKIWKILNPVLDFKHPPPPFSPHKKLVQPLKNLANQYNTGTGM